MDSDFNDINTYVSTRLPATYQDFIGFVKPLMTSRQKDKLRKLINFKFDRNTRYKLSNKRLKQLEKIIIENNSTIALFLNNFFIQLVFILNKALLLCLFFMILYLIVEIKFL